MTEPHDIAPRVRSLISERIESFEQLEVLKLLSSQPTRDWTAAAVGRELRIDADLAAMALHSLAVRELVVMRRSEREPTFRFGSANPSLSLAAEDLLRAYADDPLGIVRLLSANAIERVRTAATRAFSDAFLYRKDKKDG